MIKPVSSFASFDQLDIRVGTILSAEKAASRKPTYRMRIDFGEQIGVKVSCGAYTNYEVDALVGRQVVAVINFGAKKMGPELSEVLVLGVNSPHGEGTVFLTPERQVPNGETVF